MDTATVGVTLYVRSLRPRQTHERQRALFERMEALHEDGVVDAYDVVVWGRQLPPTPEEAETALGEQLLDRVRTFEEWARRNGYCMETTFPTRHVDSAITHESTHARSVPKVCLAEYRDDALTFVAPTDGGPTVEQRLGRLAAGSTERFRTVERVRPERESVEV